MKFIVLIIFILSLIFAPIFVSADCNKSGATVIFINGMFTFSEADANKNKDLLEKDFKDITKRADITFTLGYNASHVGGLDDIVKVVEQAYAGGFMDYDLTTILRQVHDEIGTQKILLVGHSQGTFYTNAAYNYLVNEGGVDKNSIAVYNVGTPADFVAGNGGYLTSSTDNVINSVRDLAAVGRAREPLPANINLKVSPLEKINPTGGHSFSDIYLAEAPDIIISDMDAEINGLKEGDSDKSECYIEPPADTAYLLKDMGYKTGDVAFDFIGAIRDTSFDNPINVVKLAINAWKQGWGLGKELGADIFQILDQNHLFGASLTSAPIQNIVSDSADNPPQQNPPVEVSLADYSGVGEPDINPPAVESSQDLLDDIQEKLDIIQQQIIDLLLENSKSQAPNSEQIQNPNDQNDDQNNQNQDNNQNIYTLTIYKAGGSGSKIIYPKILISEVQISPINERFIELYNPNNTSVDLTNWYLQRKDANDSSWGYLVSSTNFAGKIVSAGGYFLISRGLPNSNILSDITLSNDNSLALKNPNGEISDKLGFGNAQDPELLATQNPGDGQSIGRKAGEQETDNNLNDFELDTPTPKAQNKTYVSPITPQQAPAFKNILISEIQVAGKTADDEFVELYNPNNIAVNLAGFALKKETSGGTESNLVSSDSFTGTVPALGYFLIAPQDNSDGTLNYTGAAVPDLRYSGKSYSIAINNTILLYNNDAVPTLLDEVGCGSAQDFRGSGPAPNPGMGQSVGRKILADGTEKNTIDSSADFELDFPTPKAQNIMFSSRPASSIAITTPADKLIYAVGDLLDLTGLVVTGTYSDDSKQVETITIANVTGFDSSAPAIDQILTITFGGQTTTYTVDITSPNFNISSEGIFKTSDFYPPDLWVSFNLSGAMNWLVLSSTLQDTGFDFNSFLGCDYVTSPMPLEAWSDYWSPKRDFSYGNLSCSGGVWSLTPSKSPPVTLQSIAITTPATKLFYNVGDPLDLTGLVVTGTYSDNYTQVETIVPGDITGFDSSVPVTGQILAITFDGQTTTYTVNIVAPNFTISPAGVFMTSDFYPPDQLVDILPWNFMPYSAVLSTTGFDFNSAVGCSYFTTNPPQLIQIQIPSHVYIYSYGNLSCSGGVWSLTPSKSPPVTLQSIAITTPANKLTYNAGDSLDIDGLVVTGTYSDSTTKIETITPADIAGFDSTIALPSEILTITVAGVSTTYEISIAEASVAQLKIISSPQTITAGTPSSVFTVESQNVLGELTKVLTTTYVSLSSDSPTGLFSSAPAGGPCGSDWTKTSITISKDTAHKSFCYKDDSSGTYTITVSANSLSPDSQAIVVGVVAL